MLGFRRIMGTAVLLLLATAPADRAAAAQGVFVEVNPNTIQAGYQVGIQASCGEDLNPASVKSGAFGEITLTPPTGSQYLTGSATVPADTRAGEYKVDLKCANGATASAELFVLGMARPTKGPNAGGGGIAAAANPGDHAPALLAGTGLAALAAGSILLAGRRRSDSGAARRRRRGSR
jgi:hypothetical protein